MCLVAILASGCDIARPRRAARHPKRRQDLAFVDVLRRHSGDRPWWIGYLDTSASDIVLWDAPKVTLYYGWSHVFVLAGPDQAAGSFASSSRH